MLCQISLTPTLQAARGVKDATRVIASARNAGVTVGARHKRRGWRVKTFVVTELATQAGSPTHGAARGQHAAAVIVARRDAGECVAGSERHRHRRISAGAIAKLPAPSSPYKWSDAFGQA